MPRIKLLEEVATSKATAAPSPPSPLSPPPPPSLEEKSDHRDDSDNVSDGGPRKRAKISKDVPTEQLGQDRNESPSPDSKGNNDETIKEMTDITTTAARSSAKRPKPENIYSNPNTSKSSAGNATNQWSQQYSQYYSAMRNDYEQRMRAYQQYQWATAVMTKYNHDMVPPNNFSVLPGGQMQFQQYMTNVSRTQQMSSLKTPYSFVTRQPPQWRNPAQRQSPKEDSTRDKPSQVESSQDESTADASIEDTPMLDKLSQKKSPQLQSPQLRSSSQRNQTQSSTAHSQPLTISQIRHLVLTRKKFCNVVMELPPLPHSLGIALGNNHHIGLPELKGVSMDSVFRDKLPLEFCHGSWIVSMSSKKIGTVEPTSVETVMTALKRTRSKMKSVTMKFRFAKMVNPMPPSVEMDNEAKVEITKQTNKGIATEHKTGFTATPEQTKTKEREESLKRKKIALLDFFSDPSSRPMAVVLREKNQGHMYKAVNRYVVESKNKRLKYLAGHRNDINNQQEAIEFINNDIPVEVEHHSIHSKASKRALAVVLGREIDTDKMSRSIFWESIDAAKLFGCKHGDDVRKTLQERVDLLKEVNKTEDNYKKVVPNDETLKLYNSRDIHLVRQKAQYLVKAYVVALERMGQSNWTECCEMAVKELNELGISLVKRANTVQMWNAEFRKEHKFAHAGIIEKRNGPKISKTLFFDYFPSAKDLFLDFINDNKHRISIKFVRDGFAQKILPEIEKQSREDGTFGNDSPEQKLLARMLASPPSKSKISVWMRAFNIEWDHYCTKKGEAWGKFMKANKKSPIGGYGGFGNNIDDIGDESQDQDDVEGLRKVRGAAWESFQKSYVVDEGSDEMVSLSDDMVDAEESFLVDRT